MVCLSSPALKKFVLDELQRLRMSNREARPIVPSNRCLLKVPYCCREGRCSDDLFSLRSVRSVGMLRLCDFGRGIGVVADLRFVGCNVEASFADAARAIDRALHRSANTGGRYVSVNAGSGERDCEVNI